MTAGCGTRKLSGPEADLIIYLLKVGAAVTPVTLLSGGKPLALQLWRLGLINIWYRQTLESARLAGPFYTLTRTGEYRAGAIIDVRATRRCALLRQGTNPDLQSEEALI